MCRDARRVNNVVCQICMHLRQHGFNFSLLPQWAESWRLRLVDCIMSIYWRALFVKWLQRMQCSRLPNSQWLLTSPSISGETSCDTKKLLFPLEPWRTLMPVLAVLSPPPLSLSGPASLCYNNEVFCLLLLLWSEQLNKSLIILFFFCYLLLSASLFSLDALVFEGWGYSHW